MLPQKYQAYLKALRLIVNGIVYITAYPEDIDTQWPENTPTEHPQKVSGRKPETAPTREVSVSKPWLYRDPYVWTPIYLPTARDLPPRAQSTHAGHTWVEGHWKRQPYGPKNQLRRWQWRMPHRRIVNSRTPDEELGHESLTKLFHCVAIDREQGGGSLDYHLHEVFRYLTKY